MSSSFKENFERSGADESLEHDDSAFHYFTVALLTTLLVPATYKYLLEPMFYGAQVIR